MPLDPNQMTPVDKMYAQIDADQAEYVRAANEALAGMRGVNGQWWSYSVSHRSFELVVGDPFGQGNIVLFLTSCDAIGGPISWLNQQLVVVWDGDRERPGKSWEFVLQDESVGFRVVAGTFGWRRDYDLVRRYGSLSDPRRGTDA